MSVDKASPAVDGLALASVRARRGTVADLLNYAKTLLMALGGTSCRRSALCHLILGDGGRLNAMSNTLPSAAAHYRELALDALAAAKLIEDPHNRRIIERVALGYENLAAQAEASARTAELVASIITSDEKPA